MDEFRLKILGKLRKEFKNEFDIAEKIAQTPMEKSKLYNRTMDVTISEVLNKVEKDLKQHITINAKDKVGCVKDYITLEINRIRDELKVDSNGRR